MAETRGFLKYKRKDIGHKAVAERIHDFNEFNIPLTPDELVQQAARCMDCGVPFCHGIGCPLKNNIPDFNDMIYQGQWQRACQILHTTNNFPEITGRVCPALCEAACTLGINDEPVLIRHIENQIVERGFAEGWIKPLIAEEKTGKKVAVIGSGPAGLAAAQQLARIGHSVVVYEKDDRPGGLVRYGIPNFKLDKGIIDRRIEQLLAEGIDFEMGVEVGKDISVSYLEKHFDCVCLAMGAGKPRDLEVAGRDSENVLFAMDFLSQQSRYNENDIKAGDMITAKGKSVVVIGGGDTGSDCVGTAIRQGAKEVYQFEILPKPPESRPVETPWPMWPKIMRTSTSHEEGCERRWSILTKELVAKGGKINELRGCEIEWINDGGNWKMKEVSGTEFSVKVDLVLIAMGFVHVVHEGLVKDLGVELDGRGNIVVSNCQSSKCNIFAAGDTVSGASLVVRAIDSGRKAADAINAYLA
ncbi:MAG: glutamate synthase subunit beta [Planctomycetes bacterium]|nr:glutamate synthase subunit beta [Planctomycetota bacterium]